MAEVRLHERQVPPLAMQTRRAVVEDQFENRARSLPIALDSESHDFSPHERWLLQGQIADVQGVAAVLIPEGAVQKEVADSEDFQAGQLRCPLRSNAVKVRHARLQVHARSRSHHAVYKSGLNKAQRCGVPSVFGGSQKPQSALFCVSPEVMLPVLLSCFVL